MSLEEIGRKNFTEKVGHGYLPIYEKLWLPIQEEPITLLEIGIYNGNSMRTWCEWFPNATIVGIDHNPNNPMKVDRAKTHFGKQEDWEFLSTVANEYKQFDIIIDDGSHIWLHQQLTFEYLWPVVKPGGMYIIEDLHTSLDPFWSGGAATNTVDFIKPLVEEVILYQQDIYSIQVYNKLAIFHKGPT